MKRVVFLADSISSQSAGIHYFGLQLIRGIISAFPSYEYHSISSDRIELENITQHIVKVNSQIPMHLRIRQLTSVPKVVNSLHPDVVIELAHFGPFNISSSAQRITVIHDMTAITHPEFHSRSSHYVQKMTLPKVVKQANQIITNSVYTKQEISRVLRTDYSSKIHVLYPSIKPILKSKEQQKVKLKVNHPFFLCVGTIEPRKNYLAVLKAFEQFHASLPSYSLVIIGRKGWKNGSIYRQWQQSPIRHAIHIIENISDEELHGYYEAASAYISASHVEGFGLPILEAASYGLPLIVANNSSQREIVRDFGLSFNNSEELLAHLMEITKDSEELEQLRVKSKELYADIASTRAQQFESLVL